MFPTLARSIVATARTMSAKPSVLLVGLPLPPFDLPPMKVGWSDEPVSITQQFKELGPLMSEKGYDGAYEYLGWVWGWFIRLLC